MCRSIAVIVLLAGIPAVVVADSEFSVSIGINRTQATSVLPPPPPPSFLLADLDLDRESSGTRFFAVATAAFTPWLAFEAGWAEFAEANGALTLTEFCIEPCVPPPVSETHILETSGNAGWVAYRPSYRYGRWDLSGSVGKAKVQRKLTSPTLGSFTRDTTETTYGVGVTYWFSDLIGATVQVNEFGDDAEMVGLRLSFRF